MSRDERGKSQVLSREVMGPAGSEPGSGTSLGPSSQLTPGIRNCSSVAFLGIGTEGPGVRRKGAETLTIVCSPASSHLGRDRPWSSGVRC